MAFGKRTKITITGLLLVKPQGDCILFLSADRVGASTKGVYRPNSTIEGDPTYRVIDENTIEVEDKKGFARYTRAGAR